MLCISKFVYIQHQFETFDLFTLLDGKMQSWSFFEGAGLIIMQPCYLFEGGHHEWDDLGLFCDNF